MPRDANAPSKGEPAGFLFKNHQNVSENNQKAGRQCILRNFDFYNGYSIFARVFTPFLRTSECKAVLAAILNHKAKHKVGGAISALRQTRKVTKTR